MSDERDIAREGGLVRMALGDLCSACPVERGECPQCGTFWWYVGGKRVGQTPVLPGSPYWRNSGDTGPSWLSSYAPRLDRPYLPRHAKP